MGIAIAPARITVQRVTALSVFPEHALYIVSVYGSLRLLITKPPPGRKNDQLRSANTHGNWPLVHLILKFLKVEPYWKL